MKITYQRVIAFFALIAISIGFGFAFDGIATVIEKQIYPVKEEYANEVRASAEEFGVPEHILWAVIRNESNFESGKTSEDGKIGLMQISPARFQAICVDVLGKPESNGILYDPATNIRVGAALISELYHRYGNWKTAYAAYFAGEEQVDAWLADPELVNEAGELIKIPDKATAKYVKKMTKASKQYATLYYDEA